MKEIIESNMCVAVFGYKHSPLGESSIALRAHLFGSFAEKWLPEGKTNFERRD